MTTELATTIEGSTGLQIAPDQTSFNDAQRAALEALGVADAPAGDVELLFHIAKRSGLDPFARQIYLIPRNQKMPDGSWGKKWTIQTGIDGLRVLRDRLGTYQGHTTEWCGEDGAWKDVWLAPTPPAAARVSVYVKGRVVPQVGIALWSEYVQTTNRGDITSMWKSKGTIMLAKCAEAIAYRQAFPQDFSGLYVSEEMGSADTPLEARQAPQVPARLAATPGRPSEPVDESATADEWAVKARNALTRVDALTLYREARDKGILDYHLTTGEILKDVLTDRGHHLAEEEAQANSGEPEVEEMPEPLYDPSELV